MAWEKRRKRSYFYSKQRFNGKVRSIYFGAGEVGNIIFQSEKGRIIERKIRKARKKQHKSYEKIMNSRLNVLSEINKNIVDALFLLNGYHQHKRQWRKKRC